MMIRQIITVTLTLLVLGQSSYGAKVNLSELCCSPDIVIVLDRSYINQEIYLEKVQPVIAHLFDSMGSCVDARVAFLEYASSVHIRSLLKDYTKMDSLKNFVKSYKPGKNSLGKRSMLSTALEGTLTQILSTARGKRSGHSTYILVFMGNNPVNSRQAAAKARLLRISSHNAQIMVFGVKDDFSPEVAHRVCSRTSYFYPSSQVNVNLVDRILPLMCRPNSMTPVSTDERSAQRNQVKTSHRKIKKYSPDHLCFEHHIRQGVQLIADPENCHNFIECNFLLESPLGQIKHCNKSKIFSRDIMSCVPEGPTPCSDYCRHSHLTHSGCYGLEDNCATYFVCTHGISYAKCCQPGTRFHEDSCQCLVDAEQQCKSTCKMMNLGESFLKAKDIITYGEQGICTDDYNNKLRPHRGRPDLYEVIEEGEFLNQLRIFTVPCAVGSMFSLETCRCEHLVNEKRKVVFPSQKPQQCRLYLPFDSDIADYSANKFSISTRGKIRLNKEGDSAVRDGKSLFINDGFLRIPGLSGRDQKNQASWCLFYRCQQEPNSYECVKSGGLLSNSKGESYSIILASLFKNQIMAKIRLIYPTSNLNMNSSVDISNGWNQVCLVYDGSNLEIYSNGVSVAKKELNGQLPVVGSPYMIGTDDRYGTFAGSIDEVLLCDHALSYHDVLAHYNGNVMYLKSKGLIPSKE